MDNQRPWPEDAKTPSLPAEHAEHLYMVTTAVQRIIDDEADGLAAYLELTRQHRAAERPPFMLHRRDHGEHLVARSFPNETRPLILTEQQSISTFGAHPKEETGPNSEKRHASTGWGIAVMSSHLSEALILVTLIIAITAACNPEIVPW